jgi:sulfate permease, SulP family
MLGRTAVGERLTILGPARLLVGWASWANFISEPVLKGFIIGLALTIIVGQLPKLFGVPKGGRGVLSDHRTPSAGTR